PDKLTLINMPFFLFIASNFKNILNLRLARDKFLIIPYLEKISQYFANQSLDLDL
ncbi:hypothetical protein ABPG72_020831, partial [Tetrahymena utriculariae]